MMNSVCVCVCRFYPRMKMGQTLASLEVQVSDPLSPSPNLIFLYYFGAPFNQFLFAL